MADLATKSLLHDKMRFLITVTGVAFAVTLVFVQVGLAHEFSETYVKRVRAVPGVQRADNLIVWRVLLVKIALAEQSPLKLGQRVEVLIAAE